MSGFIVESPNAQRQADVGGRVKDLPRPNFVLYYHPAEWQLTAEGELTPSISHMSIAPGAGADERGNFELRAAELARRGYVRIPHDVLGDALPDYVAKYTNQRGKGVHRTVFQQPYNDATGNTRWRTDMEAVRAFVRVLRKRGVVARPRPEVVEGVLIAQQRMLDRLAKVRPADTEQAKARHEAKLQRMERAIAYLQRELEESADVYGRPSSPARSLLADLLDAAEDGAEDVARAVKAPRKKKKADAPESSAPPAGGFSLDDEDL